MRSLHGLLRIRRLLRTRGIPNLWGAALLIGIVRWTEILALGIYTWAETASALLVAIVAACNWVPSALFGAFVGGLAERVDRRRLLLVGIGIYCALLGVLAFLALSGRLELWHVAAGTLASGLLWTTEYPVRKTLLGEMAGARRAATALSFDIAIGTATLSLGPLTSGFLMRDFGLHAFYLLAIVLMSAAWVLVAGVRSPGARAMPASSERSGFLASLLEGFRHARAIQPVAGVLVITLTINFFGFSCLSMLPVIGASKLLVGPDLVGILSSMPGAGSFLGLLLLTMYARPAWYMRLFVAGTISMLFAICVFSTLPWYAACLVVLFLGGLGEAGFAAMQATITFLAAPAHLRSRIMGLLVVCIGVGPLGILHTGALAEWLGADVAIRVVTLEGLACCALCLWRLPALRRGAMSPAQTRSRSKSARAPLP